MTEREELRKMAADFLGMVDCVPPVVFMPVERQNAIMTRLAKFVLEITEAPQLLYPSLEERNFQESTRDVVCVFQARRWHVTGIPVGYTSDEGGIRKIGVDDNPTYLTMQELADRECAIEEWHTEAVYLTRGEASRYGQNRSYNYPDGWRVYGVPAEGELARLLKVGDWLWHGQEVRDGAAV